MQKSDAEDLTIVSRQDFPILTTAMPINAHHRNLALGIIILQLIVVAVGALFSNIPLARVDAFVPVVQTITCVVDLITAAFLFGQYLVRPKYPLLVIASGYVFSGLFAFAQTLAFPGAYSATGLIGDGISSGAWLFVLWHGSFSLAVIVYALSKDVDEKEVNEAVSPSIRSNAATIGVTIACILGVVVGLTWIVTQGSGYLPTLYNGVTTQTPVARGLDAFLWLLSAAALLLLFVHRRTILDLWLMVILVVWWPNFVLPVLSPVVRFTLGWYVGRGFAVLASSTLLIVLLGESTALYARLANAILLLRREREDRLMSIEAATSAIVHEVRQPLTAIAMQSRAALRWLGRVPPGPEIEEIRECLNSTTDAVNRAEEIVKSIRELFRQTPLRRTMLQLNDIVREVLKLTEHDLHVEGVSVTTEYDDNLPLVNVDHTQIQQVILNLIKNAIDAMRSVSPSKRHLRLCTGFDGKLVALYVQDTGPGIGVKDRERIFEPFFTTKSTGTGLGLSICRTIVETHGGVLRLAKTDPHGSSFEVAFPISSTSDSLLMVDGRIRAIARR